MLNSPTEACPAQSFHDKLRLNCPYRAALLNSLVLDIKIVIATKLAHLPYPEDVSVWNALMIYDEEFREYARSKSGAIIYVKNFVKELRCYLTLCPKPFIRNKTITSSASKPQIIARILFGNSVIWPSFGVIHTKNGILHNDSDFAAINIDGYLVWIKDGDVHRDGLGPAIITVDSLQWYSYGGLHRIDEPASISLRDGKGIEWTWWKRGIYELGENEDGTEMIGLSYLHRHRSYRIESPINICLL